MNSTESKPGADAPETKPVPEAAKPQTAVRTVRPPVEGKPPQTKVDAKADRPKRDTRTIFIFLLSITGLAAALAAAYWFGGERKAQPPLFAPVSNPYDTAIYANGIIESDQSGGVNVNIFAEVAGPVTQIFVREGQQVLAGAPLFTVEDSIQRAATEQLRFLSEGALALLNELKAQPRPETLEVAAAQVALGEANLKAARDQYDKDRASFDIDPKSVSRNVLDVAEDAVRQAASSLEVARKQYGLTKAGAWSFDVLNQEKQYAALQQSYASANALLMKHALKAPIDGIVLAVNSTVGSYVSPQGAYDPYTQLFNPIILMGPPQDHLAVRCYVDEILISRMPSGWHIRAQMSIRGSYTNKIPLEFVRVQPYVSPKIELSNQRQERVDLRVLPVVFRFEKRDAPVYPGQLVDVYIGWQ